MNVTKIILTRCQIFHLKCTKFNFRLAEAAYSAPKISYLWILGKGRERESEKVRKRGKGNGEMVEGVGDRRGKGREGVGRKREFAP